MTDNFPCCKYLNLPTIPLDVMGDVLAYFYDTKDVAKSAPLKYGDADNPVYAKTEIMSKDLEEWLRRNICDTMHYAFQIIPGQNGALPRHKDIKTSQKLCYVIYPGGDNVRTDFFDDDAKLLQSIKIDSNRWHILDVTKFHEVNGIEEGKARLSITGKVFR